MRLVLTNNVQPPGCPRAVIFWPSPPLLQHGMRQPEPPTLLAVLRHVFRVACLRPAHLGKQVGRRVTPERGFVSPTARPACVTTQPDPRRISQAPHSHSADDEPVSSPASLWNKNKGQYTGRRRSGDKFISLVGLSVAPKQRLGGRSFTSGMRCRPKSSYFHIACFEPRAVAAGSARKGPLTPQFCPSHLVAVHGESAVIPAVAETQAQSGVFLRGVFVPVAGSTNCEPKLHVPARSRSMQQIIQVYQVERNPLAGPGRNWSPGLVRA